MARPLKDGIDYFPLDVGFLGEKKVKLIKAEFGSMGILIIIALLADIYGENGYYKRWDSDDCLLMSEGVGCGCTPNIVAEVVQGCVRRSFFNERVFDVFSVLTSAGIQRRYLRAVAERSNITICKDYFLLDTSNPKDVPEGTLKKITFIPESQSINGIIRSNNSNNPPDNTQSKVKESRVKESRESNSAPDGDGDEPQLDESNRNFSRAISAFQNKISPTASGIVIDGLKSYSASMDADVINRALDIALAEKKPYWSYIKGILNRYANDDVKTLDDAIRVDAEYSAKKKSKEVQNGRNSKGNAGHEKRKWNLNGSTEL